MIKIYNAFLFLIFSPLVYSFCFFFSWSFPLLIARGLNRNACWSTESVSLFLELYIFPYNDQSLTCILFISFLSCPLSPILRLLDTVMMINYNPHWIFSFQSYSLHPQPTPLIKNPSLVPSALSTTCPVSTYTRPACPTVTQYTGIGSVGCTNHACGPEPDCIIESTITEGCPGICCPTATPTTTVKYTCPTCQTGCGTSYTTVTEC